VVAGKGAGQSSRYAELALLLFGLSEKLFTQNILQRAKSATMKGKGIV